VNEKEQKLFRLALDPSASAGEIQNAAIALIMSLRARGASAYDKREANAFGFGPSPPPPPPPSRNPFRSRPEDWPGWIEMPFGKYSGKRLSEIDPGYLRWCTEHLDGHRNRDLINAMGWVLSDLARKARQNR
jgi:hypothetical protein